MLDARDVVMAKVTI